MLDASAITSAGLVYTLFHWAEISRVAERSEHCLMYIKKIAVNSMRILHQGGGQCFLANGHTLTFDASGVCNFYECLDWCHGNIKDSLAGTWEDMKASDILTTEMSRASTIDIAVFLAIVRRHRRRNRKHSWTARITDVWAQCFWGVIRFLAAYVNHHCRYLQRAVPDIGNRAIPSRKKKPPRNDGENDPET